MSKSSVSVNSVIAVINEYMDAAAELGRNPVSKHQIQPEYRDEQADADREIFIFPFQLTTCRTGNLTRSIHTLASTFSMPTSYQ